MKKFLLSTLAVLGMASMAFAGNGTQASPYTVSQVRDLCPEKGSPVVNDIYVQGYIVGYMPSTNTLLSNAIFSAGDVNTNLVLGESSSEDQADYCIAIQLPSGAVRNALNLKDNPGNLKHEVILKGNIEWYCSGPGVKSVSSYEWVGEAPTPGDGGSSSDSNTFLSSTMDNFEILDVNLPADLNYVWSWDNSYNCAKASAFYNNTKYATDSYLISPAITLSADTKTASFQQAANKFDAGSPADYFSVCVREGTSGNWTVVTPSAWPTGTDWTFVDSQIDLSAFAGKTIQIAFRYTSSEASAGTWEVKNLKIGGTASPSTPSGVMTVTEALSFINGGGTGNAQVKGYVTSITEISTSYGNATYAIADAAGGSPTLGVYRGYYLNGDKFTSEDQLKVGDLVVVEGELVNYMGNTPQFTTGSKLVSINAGGGGDQPSNPGTPTGQSVTFDFTDPSSLGIQVGDATEYELSGMSVTSAPATVSFESDASASTKIRLWNSSGNWTMRFYKDTEFTITVTDQYLLTGIVFDGTNLANQSVVYSNGAIANNIWTPATPTNTLTVSKNATGNNPTVKTMTVYYTGASGVDEIISADDAEAVYYNLQGVKVANPERGIFIKVVGNKAVKVVK